jgi:hypothetical protein
MDSLKHIKLKRGLKTLGLEKKLFDTINERIHELPEYNTLRLNVELILLVCNLVENGYSKDIKKNKKELVVKILNEIFQYNNTEVKQLDETIQFLFDTGKIKKVMFIKKLIAYLVDWFKRKIG